jgi:cofilin
LLSRIASASVLFL